MIVIAAANRRFKFHKRCQLFIGTHDKPLSVVTMCVCNDESLPVGNPPSKAYS
jgi:hypothetical protein